MSANENRPVAIQVSGVKKMYRLGQIGGGTLQADLQSWWARKRGKEDPNTKIGEGERIKGQTFMALNGIDLTIYQGEAVGIIGSNGAGKSTLLKLLSKVTAPTEGEIDIYGRIASMLEVGTGFNGELTGRENVYMNGAILGMTKQEIDAKMEQIIEFSEVRDFIDTPVKRYSSGMFVKLAFSVAAHLDSEIMIMDEVLAVGDMAFQKKCLTKMREAAKQDGRTVLYVSHNMNTIRQLCDRCIVLDKGKVVFEGNVEEAVDLYLGNKQKNKLVYDYSNLTRNDISSFKAKLMRLTINRDNNKLKRGDPLSITLRLQINVSMQDLRFRFELYHSGGNVIGSFLCDSGIDVISGSVIDVSMILDTSNLAEGKYYAVVLPYETDGMGHQIHTDRIESTMNFEVENTNDSGLIWLHRYWGSVIFNSIDIISVKKCNFSSNPI